VDLLGAEHGEAAGRGGACEQLGVVEHVGVLRPAGAVREVVAVVAQDEQVAAVGDRVCGRGQDAGQVGAGQVQVEHEDQVEGADAEVGGGGVGDLPP